MAATYTKNGTKSDSPVKLNPAVFGVKEVNQQALKLAYDAYLANGRVNLAKTKTRGQVKGSGRKPWRQKGTGRARVGARSTPVWRGGGTIFGPLGNENYSKSLNKKAKQNALRGALSALNQANMIKVIESVELKTPKTKDLVKLIGKLDLNGYSLLVVEDLSRELKLASANITDIKVVQANYLNVARILDADNLVFTKAALNFTENWLSPKAKEEKS